MRFLNFYHSESVIVKFVLIICLTFELKYPHTHFQTRSFLPLLLRKLTEWKTTLIIGLLYPSIGSHAYASFFGADIISGVMPRTSDAVNSIRAVLYPKSQMQSSWHSQVSWLPLTATSGTEKHSNNLTFKSEIWYLWFLSGIIAMFFNLGKKREGRNLSAGKWVLKDVKITLTLAPKEYKANEVLFLPSLFPST